jgi:hypothetical protein
MARLSDAVGWSSRRESSRRETLQRIVDELLDECFDRCIASPVNRQGVEHLKTGQCEQYIDKVSLPLTRGYPPDEHCWDLPSSLGSLLQALRNFIVQFGHSRELVSRRKRSLPNAMNGVFPTSRGRRSLNPIPSSAWVLRTMSLARCYFSSQANQAGSPASYSTWQAAR